MADPASCGRFVGALANLGYLSAGNWAFVGCCRGISLAADNLREVARHMGASVAELSAADSGIGAHRNLRKSQECTSLCTVEIWMYRRECVGCTPKVFTRYTKECGAHSVESLRSWDRYVAAACN